MILKNIREHHVSNPKESVISFTGFFNNTRAKFCKEYEIHENYNSEDTYEISDHRCSPWRPNEVQNTHARTRYSDAISTK